MNVKGIDQIKLIKEKEDEIKSRIEKATAECEALVNDAKEKMGATLKKKESELQKNFNKNVDQKKKAVDASIEESRQKAMKDSENIRVDTSVERITKIVLEIMKNNVSE